MVKNSLLNMAHKYLTLKNAILFVGIACAVLLLVHQIGVDTQSISSYASGGHGLIWGRG